MSMLLKKCDQGDRNTGIQTDITLLLGGLYFISFHVSCKVSLLAPGLSEERIEQNMYRTLLQSWAARCALVGMLCDFHDLEGVPGFFVEQGYPFPK